MEVGIVGEVIGHLVDAVGGDKFIEEGREARVDRKEYLYHTPRARHAMQEHTSIANAI